MDRYELGWAVRKKVHSIWHSVPSICIGISIFIGLTAGMFRYIANDPHPVATVFAASFLCMGILLFLVAVGRALDA